jgi:putative transposase
LLVSEFENECPTLTIEFKENHFPKSVILYAVFFYVRYGVSYRDLEEIMAERGVVIDHATLNRWVVKFSRLIAASAQTRKRPTTVSWRMPSRDIASQYPVR